MSTVLVSGADERYGFWLLNMVGSVRANSDVFDRIVVYDLGLSPFQRRLAGAVDGVEIRTVPPFVPHWRQGFTWRSWVWTHLDADVLFWLDAGVTVLSSLADAVDQARERGYFVVGQGHPVRLMLPSEYFELYEIPDELPERETVAGGIIAFSKTGAFYDRVVVPTFEDSSRGVNLGVSAAELEARNWGLGRVETPIIRDCPLFRPGQVILNIHFYKSFSEPVVDDLDRWAAPRLRGGREPVIWAHRRSGDFRYLPHVPYRMPVRLVGTPFGVVFRARWWLRAHRWLFRPSTYVAKTRGLVAGRRRAT